MPTKKMLESLFARERLSKLSNTFKGYDSSIHKDVVGWVMGICNAYSWSYRCLFMGIKIMDYFLYKSIKQCKIMVNEVSETCMAIQIKSFLVACSFLFSVQLYFFCSGDVCRSFGPASLRSAFFEY